MTQPLLFQSLTSYTPEYQKEPPRKPFTTKSLFAAMRSSLYNRYSFAQKHYYTAKINDILSRHGQASTSFRDEACFLEQHEYLFKYHTRFESIRKLKILVKYNSKNLFFPRFFQEDKVLDGLMASNQFKKRVLRDKYIRRLQQNFDSAAPKMAQKRPIFFDPVLKDLNYSNPTTIQMLKILSNIEQTPGSKNQFKIELEGSRIHFQCAHVRAIKGFDDQVKKSFNTTSTKTSTCNQTQRLLQESPMPPQNFQCLSRRVVENRLSLLDLNSLTKKQPSSNADFGPQEVINFAYRQFSNKNSKHRKKALLINPSAERVSSFNLLSAQLTKSKVNLMELKKPFYSPKGLADPKCRLKNLQSIYSPSGPGKKFDRNLKVPVSKLR